MFDQDSKKVMRLIKNNTFVTPADSCINQVKCGHVAMQKLQENYNGKSEGERQKIQAREELNKFHYCHEHTLPFEKYITAPQSKLPDDGKD